MQSVARTLSSLLVLGAALALPASTLATGGFNYRVVHDYCGGPLNWTAYYKVREVAAGSTAANRLTIDSWVRANDPGSSGWYRADSWPRVSTSFAVDGTSHHLTLARHAAGGIDVAVKIVFKLRAWHNSTLLWSKKVVSVAC
jgi:hypothetical protein